MHVSGRPQRTRQSACTRGLSHFSGGEAGSKHSGLPDNSVGDEFKKMKRMKDTHATILMKLENIMWTKADTKGYIIWFHLYEIIRIGKPIKSRSVIVKS